MTETTTVTHEPHTAPCAGGWAIGMGSRERMQSFRLVGAC